MAAALLRAILGLALGAFAIQRAVRDGECLAGALGNISVPVARARHRRRRDDRPGRDSLSERRDPWRGHHSVALSHRGLIAAQTRPFVCVFRRPKVLPSRTY